MTWIDPKDISFCLMMDFDKMVYDKKIEYILNTIVLSICLR
jgi:hypothetical protein